MLKITKEKRKERIVKLLEEGKEQYCKTSHNMALITLWRSAQDLGNDKIWQAALYAAMDSDEWNACDYHFIGELDSSMDPYEDLLDAYKDVYGKKPKSDLELANFLSDLHKQDYDILIKYVKQQ